VRNVMFTRFASSIIVSSVLSGLALGDTVSGDELWAVDQKTVFVGGCVTITVNQPSRQAYKYALSIDGGAPVRLVDKVGPALRGGRRTLILLSHQLFSAEGMQVDNQNPQLFHMVPLFHSAGSVRLTLLSGDESLGTKVVTVIDAPGDAQAAIALLFPVIDRTRRDPTAASLLLQILMGSNLSNILKSRDDAIEKLHEELEVVAKHPDWSEIAAMTVAGVEATAHYNSTIKACRLARDEGRELDTEPPIPPSISQALEREVKGPYAKAIQDGIRKTIAARHWIPSLIEVPTPAQP